MMQDANSKIHLIGHILFYRHSEVKREVAAQVVCKKSVRSNEGRYEVRANSSSTRVSPHMLLNDS